MSIFYHEQLYRTPTLMEKIKDFSITICGAGALGGNLTENLARSGFGKLRVIDFDRIEERNLSTQPYYKSDIGAYKVKILTNSIYRAIGIGIDGCSKELTSENCHKLLSGSQLLIDTFDNSVSRKIVKDYCEQQKIPCLHVGLYVDYAEIIWNENYRVPSATNDDICDYALARNLAIMAMGVASEVIITFIESNQQKSYTITIGDFAVKQYLS